MSACLFRYHNPNPGKAACGDCAVRALSLALGEDWSTIYEDLCELGGHIYRMPNDKDCVTTYLTRRGFRRTGVPIKKGNKRLTVSGFTELHQEGVYILEIHNHLVAVVNGLYWDTWDSGSKCIYNIWARS